jgi:DNA-binding XRE family transcriptional regulator
MSSAKYMTKAAKRMTRPEREAARLARQILDLGGPKAIERLERMHAKIDKRRKLIPMKIILAKIPWNATETSLKARARRLGISRQYWYSLINEQFRPGADLAQKIADLTGLTVEQIRGSNQ